MFYQLLVCCFGWRSWCLEGGGGVPRLDTFGLSPKWRLFLHPACLGMLMGWAYCLGVVGPTCPTWSSSVNCDAYGSTSIPGLIWVRIPWPTFVVPHVFVEVRIGISRILSLTLPTSGSNGSAMSDHYIIGEHGCGIYGCWLGSSNTPSCELHSVNQVMPPLPLLTKDFHLRFEVDPDHRSWWVVLVAWTPTDLAWGCSDTLWSACQWSKPTIIFASNRLLVRR